MKITMVPKEEIRNVWNDVEPMLAKAIPYCENRFTIADVYVDVMTGAQSLWFAFDDKDANAPIYGAVTVRIVDYPNCRALRLETLGGQNVRRWLREGFASMEAYAKAYQCQKIEAFGRPQWGRFFNRLGLKPFAVQYEFNLE